MYDKRKPRLRGSLEQESNVGKFRVEMGLSSAELAEMCGCSTAHIAKLQTGEMSPFYEDSVEVDGVLYSAGSVRPYAEIMSIVFDKSIAEVFPRYACEFGRREDVLEDYGSRIEDFGDDVLDFGYCERRIYFERFLSLIDERLSDREKGVLFGRFYEGLSLRELSEVYDVSDKRIGQIKEEVLVKVNRFLDTRFDLKEGLLDNLRFLDSRSRFYDRF